MKITKVAAITVLTMQCFTIKAVLGAGFPLQNLFRNGRALCYSRLGVDFISRLQSQQKQVRIMSLSYSRLGVDFIVSVSSGHIDAVLVYQPTGRPHADERIRCVGPNQVVPGVGAYGVRIGDATSVFQSLTGVKSLSTFQGVTYYVCQFTDGRLLSARVRGGRVLGIIIRGKFETPEGLTQRADAQAIKRVYGPPDEVTRFVRPHIANPGFAMALLMLVVGCLSGILLRRFRRRAHGGKR